MKSSLVVVGALLVILAAVLWGQGNTVASLPNEMSVEPEARGQVFLGPLAVSYEGCSQSQQTALSSAVSGINNTLSGTECTIGADLKACLEGKTGNVTIRCHGGNCTSNSRLAGEAPRGGSWVRICNRTFNNSQRLEAVLFHELVHSCDRDEKTAEACQNNCYDGRGATAPSAGEEGGTCNGTGRTVGFGTPAGVVPSGPPLAATLATDQITYTFGSTVTVIFSVQNITPTGVITFNTDWYNPNPFHIPEFGWLDIIDSQGRPWPSLVDWEMEPPVLGTYVGLPTGGIFSDTFAIRPEQYGFLPSGVYSLTYHYANWETNYYSDTYPYVYMGTANAFVGHLDTNLARITIEGYGVYLPLVVRDY